MALFLVRVELSRADGDEYDQLHEKMNGIGFKKTVLFDDGADYKLPTGTYMGEKAETAESVRAKVSALADPLSIGRASVIVCEVEHWAAYLFKDR